MLTFAYHGVLYANDSGRARKEVERTLGHREEQGKVRKRDNLDGSGRRGSSLSSC